MASTRDYTMFTPEMDMVNFSQPDHEKSEKSVQSHSSPNHCFTLTTSISVHM